MLKNFKKNIKLGIILNDKLCNLPSINQLSANVLKAAKQRFSPLFFSPDDYPDTQEIDGAFEKFCKKVDIVLELPRRCSPFSYCQKVPIMVFAYGFFSQANKHLPELWNFFWPKNSLLFSCKADMGIFNRVFSNCQEMAYLLPWPIDTKVFKPQAKDKVLGVRRNIGLDKNSPLLLYAGRISRPKNIHTLLKIFREVVKTFPDARLCIAGKIYDFCSDEYTLSAHRTDYPKVLRGLIKRYKLNAKVIFLTSLTGSELTALYCAADIFINCTLWAEENFGYAQVEAMACGTPVICSAWGGLKDTVIDSVTGYHMDTIISDNGPRVDWRRGVERAIQILQDRKLRSRLSENCLSHISENFSLNSFGENLEEIIEKSLKRSKAIEDSDSNLFRKARPELMNIYLGCLYKKIKSRQHSACDSRYDFQDKEKLHYDKFLLEPYTSAKEVLASSD